MSATRTAPVCFDQDGPVCTITLNRPAKRNAVDGVTAKALREAFERFENNEDLCVAVLTGAGGHFCSGWDLTSMTGTKHGPALAPDGSGPGPMGPTRMVLTKPVLAAVEGYAVAGGLELALMCDVRIAAKDAVFGVFCRRWGVPLIDGGTVRLPRMVGQGRALDMILTGRPVQAGEALNMGLANRVVASGEALPAALEMAAAIAAFPQACLRADRRSALGQWDHGLAEALRREGAGAYEVIEQESLAGAARFAGGAGRHGDFDT